MWIRPFSLLASTSITKGRRGQNECELCCKEIIQKFEVYSVIIYEKDMAGMNFVQRFYFGEFSEDRVLRDLGIE